ncbi:antibiotic biosynthesis monooxygenase [Streptomyces sp. NBC_00320]|uniref:antibiotic biosynthesis monooxygenase family protein n=1 Tax=unclassified Streptomyces TaxID=2593676 RepID=UPI000AB96A46|nr:antibiotic biosynthesis monooxygenase family protein [Streptomyces sp. NBC_00320]MCX5150556.1 antibiotic biosynthesis monooxygenase [Streptomyces sp. NBC_00320]
MSDDGTYWSSASWQVTEGKADEFIARWTDFLNWTNETTDGVLSGRLVRDAGDPHHFLSFGSWRDADAIDAWRADPQFAVHFGACRAVCEDVRAASYEVVVSG